MFYKTPTHRVFNNVLPSLNLRYEITKDMIARFGASRAIGRQNYNVLGTGFGTPTCDASGCKVNGPNPDLTPMTSDNVDLSWGWYFARRSAVSVSLFHSKIDGYVKTGESRNSTIELTDPRDDTVKTFFINTSFAAGREDQRHRAVVRTAVRQQPMGFHLERQPRQDQG
jgi:iron complex outermembrane receptor protein